jgi:hypothetical protein
MAIRTDREQFPTPTSRAAAVARGDDGLFRPVAGPEAAA